MAKRRCEFVDSRLRRSPPDRASAVPYGQARENAKRFPRLAHRSAAAHKLHSSTTTTRIDLDSGKDETFNRLPALAYSSRNLSNRPGPPQFSLASCALARSASYSARSRFGPCPPSRCMIAVNKWPAVATVQSLATAGHLSTAVRTLRRGHRRSSFEGSSCGLEPLGRRRR
jgi:hypothetical protein